MIIDFIGIQPFSVAGASRNLAVQGNDMFFKCKYVSCSDYKVDLRVGYM